METYLESFEGDDDDSEAQSIPNPLMGIICCGFLGIIMTFSSVKRKRIKQDKIL